MHQRRGKSTGARPGQTRKQLSSKRSVDAWDSGREERKRNTNTSTSTRTTNEHEQGGNKRLQFDPKPPTFIAATRTEMLTQRMGGFAGPLLGALWNEQEDEEDGSIIIRNKSKYLEEQQQREAGGVVRNQFGALESSDDDEDDVEAGGKKKKKAAAEVNPFEIRPASFANTANWALGVAASSSSATAAAAAANDPWKPKEPTFRPELAGGVEPANNKTEFAFKPATFQPKEAAAAFSAPLPPPPLQHHHQAAAAAEELSDDDDL